ncbi:MAG: HAD-IA family hydrolase [Endozoicomonas sp. (ex Botrylloides leachii)]|nr:HAD-IA family hydrolase [Endozoicomonas sp. (ex Botrylloides leachii)]
MGNDSRIDGVFFDLDGTLMDTASDFVFAVNQLLNDHRLPAINEQLIRDNVSSGSKKLASIALNMAIDHPDIQKKNQQLLQYYTARINNHNRAMPATLYSGVTALIQSLERHNIQWGIVTNKPEVYTKVLLKQVNLFTRSGSIVCPDHVSKSKPDPRGLLLACKQTNCRPENSIYIGDHQRDIEAGKRAGMLTIAAIYGYIGDDDGDPADWQADFQASSVGAIEQWLAQHNWKIKQSSFINKAASVD